MTKLELSKKCESFNTETSDFASLVKGALEVVDGLTADLSKEYEVHPSTVSRWASGVAKPLPRLQVMIVKFISKKISA